METMCRYNIAIDDKLMERVRPSIGEGIDDFNTHRPQQSGLYEEIRIKTKYK